MRSTEVEHLPGPGNATDIRAGETAIAEDQGEGGDTQRFRRSADAGIVREDRHQGEARLLFLG